MSRDLRQVEGYKKDMLLDQLGRAAINLVRRHRGRHSRVTLGVRILLTDQGRVLLVRHRLLGGWYLPGGGVERDETLEQAARRELLEETSASVGVLTLHGVFSNFHDGASDHVVVFRGEGAATPRPADLEIAEACWFKLADLPPDLSPGTVRRLHERERGDGPLVGIW
ncbi:MAG: NUDIX domain-containing protein [Pseudomonadota bacterium]